MESTSLFSDDFTANPNASGKWEIHRKVGHPLQEVAWVPRQGVYLVGDSPGRAAAMFAVHDLRVRRWDAKFEFQSAKNGCCGMVFMFYKDREVYGVPPDGESQGFLPGGYGIELDQSPTIFDRQPPHVAIIEGTTENQLASVLDYRVGDGNRHTMLVQYLEGLIRVWIDFDLVLEYQLATPQYTYSGVGFAASTGDSDASFKLVDDFTLTSLPE